MISLDQIRQLDQKVRKAIERIQKLTAENESLKLKLDGYEQRIEELQKLVSEYKEDQGEIEKGILKALDQLDILEDEIETPEQSPEEPKADPEPGVYRKPEEVHTVDEAAGEESGDDAEEEDQPSSELDIF